MASGVEIFGDDGAANGGRELRSDVLCVDVEGALLKVHPQHRAFFAAIKEHPVLLFWLALWLLGGRRRFARGLAEQLSRPLDRSLDPRRSEVETLMAEAKSAGKRVELISAIGPDFVRHLRLPPGSFDEVVTADSPTGQQRTSLLNDRHPQGFSYVGHAAGDLPVWRLATEGFAVDVSPSLRRRAASEGINLVELSTPSSMLHALLESMRLHQWLKNVLILVPLGLMAPRATLTDIMTFVSGFVLFGLLTSGTYLLNDILDVEADRSHPRKLQRPIATGDLPLPMAGAAALALIAIALSGAALLSRPFLLTSLGYLLLTLAYSFRFKSIPIIDVLLIATLFTLRILAGMLLVGQPPSEWLLMFSIFFFLSLALIKRYVELGTLASEDAKALRGRGYVRDDQNFLMAFGVSSGVASLVIFAMFIASMTLDPASHYVAPGLLWVALAALSYWLMRMWLLTMRGLMPDDPVVHAARERATLILAAVMVACVLAAQVLPL